MELAHTADFLMANLGSEVNRFFYWYGKGNTDAALQSYKRSEQIIQELVRSPEMQHAKQEPQMIAEILKDKLENRNRFEISAAALEQYFQPFALRALSQHT